MSSWPSSTHFCAKSAQTRTREILGVLFFVACRMYFFIDREMVIPWRSVCIIFLRSTVPEIQFGCKLFCSHEVGNEATKPTVT